MACGSFAGNKVFVILGCGCGVRGLKVRDFSAGGLRPPWPRPEPSALGLRGSMSVGLSAGSRRSPMPFCQTLVLRLERKFDRREEGVMTAGRKPVTDEARLLDLLIKGDFAAFGKETGLSIRDLGRMMGGEDEPDDDFDGDDEDYFDDDEDWWLRPE